MDRIAWADVVEELGVVEPRSPAAVPAGWRGIAAAADAAERAERALALWNRGFLDLVPDFAVLLRDRLADVRVCELGDEWVLVYLVRADDGSTLVWLGWHPDTFGAAPPHWGSVPEPVREFLIGVHAGFTAPDGESYGLAPPVDMATYARRAGFTGPIPEWDGGIPAERLLFVTRDGGLLEYCASPDLPAGRIALVYEGDVDPREEFGAALDRLLCGRLRP